jgi:hypothetical protein
MTRDEQGRLIPLHPTEAWDQFSENLLNNGIPDHDWDRPFVVNQKVCLQKVLDVKETGQLNPNLMELRSKAENQQKESEFNRLKYEVEYLRRDNKRLEESVVTLDKLNQNLVKSKKDKNRLIVKLKEKNANLELENGYLRSKLKVGQVATNPTFEDEYVLPNESSSISLSDR